MSRGSFSNYFTGNISAGEDLCTKLSEELGVSSIRIWAFTLISDSKVIFELNDKSKSSTMSMGESHILNIPHDTVWISRMIPDGDADIEINYFYSII